MSEPASDAELAALREAIRQAGAATRRMRVAGGALCFAPVVLVCLTLLSWFVAVWLAFVVRVRLLTGRLRVEREVLAERGPVEGLWAGHSFTVRARD